MSKALVEESHTAGLQEDHEGSSRRRSWGLLVTAGVGGTLVALYALVTPFVTPALRKVCLPFVPATSAQIQNVLKMLENRSGSLVDIGSGDGRIVIAAAKRGFKAVGYELNPWLVWYSRYRAWRDGVHHNTRFYISDLWKVSFSHYTNVVVFGVPQMVWNEMSEELCVMLYCTAYSDNVSVAVSGRRNKKHDKASLLSAFSLTALELNTYFRFRLQPFLETEVYMYGFFSPAFVGSILVRAMMLLVLRTLPGLDVLCSLA